MPLSPRTRTLFRLGLIAAVGLCACGIAGAQRRVRIASAGYYGSQRAQPRIPQRALGPLQQQKNVGPNPTIGPNPGPRGEHLAEWMNAHRNLTPAQQQQALQNEPGFRDLPQQTQQRYRERLAQLNAMNPQQRENTVRNIENMERLNPQQRGQVRGAMQQLGALPPDQRRTVARTFRQLRDLPPDQRAAAMSRVPLNDAQRATLGNLMSVEPMLPPPEPAQPH